MTQRDFFMIASANHQQEIGEMSFLPDRIDYIDHPLFAQPDAHERLKRLPVVSRPQESLMASQRSGRFQLPDAPLLSAEEERALFLQMNYCKFRAARLSENERAKSAAVRRWLNRALTYRNQIVEANLRLVVAMARQFRDDVTPIEDWVSEGTIPLIRAVELFDVSRGLKFSTYAATSVRNHFLRCRNRSARRADWESLTEPSAIDSIAENRSNREREIQRRIERNRIMSRLLATLPRREQAILSARFGLEDDEGQSFREIAETVGLSKERVRVLSHRALSQLQLAVQTDAVEWPDDDSD